MYIHPAAAAILLLQNSASFRPHSEGRGKKWTFLYELLATGERVTLSSLNTSLPGSHTIAQKTAGLCRCEAYSYSQTGFRFHSLECRPRSAEIAVHIRNSGIFSLFATFEAETAQGKCDVRVKFAAACCSASFATQHL